MDVQNLKIKKANIQRILKLKMAWDRPNLKAETAFLEEKCNALQLFELKLTDYQQNLFFACGGNSLTNSSTSICVFGKSVFQRIGACENIIKIKCLFLWRKGNEILITSSNLSPYRQAWLLSSFQECQILFFVGA